MKVGAIGLVLCMAAVNAHAGAGLVFADRAYAAPVTSMKERLFRTTVVQQYDFSCGSAAVATLLTHHYARPVKEDDAFEAMYQAGEPEKIRRLGFSMLDMKRYLESLGYRAEGFRVSLDQIAQWSIPAIVLLRDKGYNHFVVVKGVRGGEILVGDPSLGIRKLDRETFEKNSNGIFLVIRNHVDVAQRHFNEEAAWQVKVRAPVREAVQRGGVSALILLLPGRNDF
jgi:hypothetical protein